jgi:hypothetical protein
MREDMGGRIDQTVEELRGHRNMKTGSRSWLNRASVYCSAVIGRHLLSCFVSGSSFFPASPEYQIFIPSTNNEIGSVSWLGEVNR